MRDAPACVSRAGAGFGAQATESLAPEGSALAPGIPDDADSVSDFDEGSDSDEGGDAMETVRSMQHEAE